MALLLRSVNHSSQPNLNVSRVLVITFEATSATLTGLTIGTGQPGVNNEPIMNRQLRSDCANEKHSSFSRFLLRLHLSSSS